MQSGEGVAQVMETDGRQLGPPQQRLELQGGDVAAPQRLAGRVAEDEVVVGQAMPERQHRLRPATEGTGSAPIRSECPGGAAPAKPAPQVTCRVPFTLADRPSPSLGCGTQL